MKDIEQVVDQILMVAYDLIVSGSEVGRTEKQITRMCHAYGMDEVEVFIITSSIMISVTSSEGEYYTRIKRIHAYHTDFYLVELLEQLSSYICVNAPSKEEILRYREKIYKEVEREHSWKGNFVSYGVFCFISMIFTCFFGGTIQDGIASFVCGIFIKIAFEFLEKNLSNRFFINTISSAIGGFIAWIIYQFGVVNEVDKVIIGNIMLLIPGLATVNALKDLISGEMMTGMLRLSDALIQAIAIAIGFAIVLLPIMGV